MKKLILGAVALAIVIIGISAMLPVNTRPEPASAAFDHSNCQYPDRWSNPPNGCDNSDPAVPECIKAFSTEQGEKDCIAEFTKQYPGTAEKREAIAEHDKPFKPAPQAVQCGGK